ncbi:conserved hypothetical protein [Trichinella spiralis]|uniref:hypothetical protein n=1 Tax=Trichinella spiralis TaxID=6334 RepID=UPI0001EFB54A|nr:conserved hypothetical protein [Trichinella spiralis]
MTARIENCSVADVCNIVLKCCYFVLYFIRCREFTRFVCSSCWMCVLLAGHCGLHFCWLFEVEVVSSRRFSVHRSHDCLRIVNVNFHPPFFCYRSGMIVKRCDL